MITFKSCPICNSQNIAKHNWYHVSPRHVTHEIMPGVGIEAAIISRYSVCQNCHLVFQNPRLSDTELEKYYSQGIYRQLTHWTIEQEDEGEAKRAKIDTEIIRRYMENIESHLDIGSSRGYLLNAVGAKVKVGVELKYLNLFSLPLTTIVILSVRASTCSIGYSTDLGLH